jgi:hypothetical protein
MLLSQQRNWECRHMALQHSKTAGILVAAEQLHNRGLQSEGCTAGALQAQGGEVPAVKATFTLFTLLPFLGFRKGEGSAGTWALDPLGLLASLLQLHN